MLKISTKNRLSKFIIFLDLDGVIIDLNQKIIDILDLQDCVSSKKDIIKTKNGFMEDCCDENMWIKIKDEKRLWEKPIISDIGIELIQKLKENFKKENIYLLSSPSDIPIAASEKVKISQNLGFDKNYILTPQKHLLADKNRILIDDLPNNIDRFKKAGGKGYLFPCLYKFEDGDISFQECWSEIMDIINQ